jgi:hypothetical protein
VRNPSLQELLVKTAATHTVTYVLIGLMAFFSIDYPRLFSETELRFLMRPTNDPLVAAGPLVQPIRGVLFGGLFYLLRDLLFCSRRGWLLLWMLLVVVGIIGPFGAAPGSLEGMIYTVIPLRVQLAVMPEILLQSFLLSFLLFQWISRPHNRWFSWTMWAAFAAAIGLPLIALTSS